jgi:hypothetical protein
MAMKRAIGARGESATSASYSGGWSRGRRGAPLAVALLVALGLIALYTLYLRSDDISPDSVYGYAFAIGGTALLTLVGAGYVVRKRLRRNWAGLLHTALRWHIAGAGLALLLILMHSAGNFHPRTGTYALYSLLALVVSGIVGKLLDRVAPRLAARAALTTLTPTGEDRIEALAGTLRVKHTAARDSQSGQRGKRGKRKEPEHAPWDLAYYDLSATPSDIPNLIRIQTAAATQRPSASDGAMERAMASESAAIKRAIGMERLYLRLVRVWRYLHSALSLVTLGLILWHLEFAATLLLGK